MLVNLTSKIINLWDMHTLQVVQSYAGHSQARLAIHSCFVGPNQSFIASGSEGESNSSLSVWSYDAC